MVQVFRLGLLRVPDLLRNRLAHPCINFDVRKFHFLVDIVQVLAVKNDENMPLREYSLAEVVLESLISVA